MRKISFIRSIIRNYYQIDHPKLARELMGIQFKNPIGLAAGFDKDARLYEELSDFGFGFIEIGTLTPKAQEGNPKKRLFRLKKDKAIINRMGFNNQGVAKAYERLKKNKNILIGGNIGKNKLTPNEASFDDYKTCFDTLFSVVDYFVINVSSPNTPDLRSLQDKAPLLHLLQSLQRLNIKKSKPKPILLKIAPDLSKIQLLDIIEVVENAKIDGIIATNTTLSRTDLQSPNSHQTGGLSGTPLKEKSTQMIRFLVKNRRQPFVIIGVGGISTVADALEKLEAGADLVQVYSGFIYEGPQLIRDINKALINQSNDNQESTLL